MRAEIITIGDEILIGQIVDTNSAWLAAQLDLLSISVKFITSIADTRESIYSSLKLASNRADLVIVTGGLGPTKDDVTKATISSYFSSPLVRDEKVLMHVKSLFEQLTKSKDFPVSNYAQAEVLACAEVLFNDVGTAPGMWVEYEGVIYVFMPGVPFEMKFLMENRVLPRLVTRKGDAKLYHAHILTVGIGEAFLAERISAIENQLPSYIKLAYLPKLGMVRLRLSAYGHDEVALKEETDAIAQKIADEVPEFLVAREDLTLEEVIVRDFAKANATVAFAESCTGGSLAGAITLVSGASQVFECGVVAYANSIKNSVLGVETDTIERHGAVSEETVLAMVNGVQQLAASTYAVATSGIAGPGGGTEEKPVGTVWIAVRGKNETITKKYSFKNNRQVNIERTVAASLIMLWKLFKRERG